MDPSPPVDKLDPEECTASGEPKTCADCHTTKTPLWRGGPTGPKSLCNACGIRYRKRRQALGLDATEGAEQQQQQQQHKKKKTKEEDEVTVELHMVGFGKDVVLKQRRRMRRRKCLGEEERAAILLMALSSGVMYPANYSSSARSSSIKVEAS